MHYICKGGCHGESDVPGECQATDCPDYGLPLQPCNRTDDKYYDSSKEKGAE